VLVAEDEVKSDAEAGSDGSAAALLLGHNLRAARAYLLKEEFQFLWTDLSATWAGRFLDRWCTQTMRSRREPMQTVAQMLRRHRPLLLNWVRAKGAISGGAVEGFNNTAKLTMRKAFGFRTYPALEGHTATSPVILGGVAMPRCSAPSPSKPWASW